MNFSLSRRQLVTGATSGLLIATPLSKALSQARVTVTEGTFQPIPIAIPSFAPGSQADGEVANGVAQVITNNLKRSGLFAPIDPAAFIERNSNPDVAPQFQNWRAINAQALVVGRMTRQSDGRLKAEFRLWDVPASNMLAGQQYFTAAESWRRIAHIISDQIYERLTGEKGYFDSRVVFVDETGPKDRRVKRLAVMDQDGANVRYLTRGADLVITPRFSPSTQEITYMEYGQGDPRVYLFNVETGQREIVGNFPGMSFSPRFSPDGQRIIMSL
ncbi:MAG: PD40 domain-containing protein, partial [Rhizobiales bacterium]|nr:PD40 domain-containing protein [Hyphomicrobiales bacterium]